MNMLIAALRRLERRNRVFEMERSMLRDLAWQAVDNLVRAQMTMVHAIADEIGLSADDRQQALKLDDRSWKAWSDFLMGGLLPTEPSLPDMLRRLAETAFDLSTVAAQRCRA